MSSAIRVRQARRRAGLSQQGLAQALGVRRSAVSNWESSNAVTPTMENLVALAKLCDVSLEWLGTGRGMMKLDSSYAVETPAVDLEFVELDHEKDLLRRFRALNVRSQRALLELAELLRLSTKRSGSLKAVA